MTQCGICYKETEFHVCSISERIKRLDINLIWGLLEIGRFSYHRSFKQLIPFLPISHIFDQRLKFTI